MANVLLTINSALGPGGLASLRAGIGMIGALAGRLEDVWKRGQQYGQMLSRLEIDISKAEKATKGLINTTEMVRGALKAQEAQTHLTADQLRDISLVAVDFARSTGQEVTPTFQKLIKSITEGNERALKPLGIDLRNVTTLADKQALAIKLLSDRASGLMIEYDNLDERLSAMDNSFGTLVDTISSSMGEFETLNSLVETAASAFDRLTDRIGAVGIKGTLIEGFAAARAGARLMAIDLMSLIGVYDKATAAALRTRAAHVYFAERVAIQQEHGREPEDAPPGMPPRPPPRTAAGRRAPKAAPTLVDMTPEQRLAEFAREAEEQRKLAQIEKERAAFMEVYHAAFAGMAHTTAEHRVSEVEHWEMERARQLEDEAAQQRKAEWQAQFQEADEVTWQREMEKEAEREEYERRRLEFRGELLEYEEARQVTHFETMLGIEQDALNASRDQWNAGLMQKMSMMAGAIRGFGSLMQVENKRAFKVGQAMAITSTIMDGIAGSIAAFRALAGISVVGPILGGLASAAALTQMGVAVAQIKKQKYGGGSSPAIKAPTMPSSGGMGASGPPASAEKSKLEITNIINLDGERVYESMKEHNLAAQQAGRGGAFAMAG